MTIHRLGETSEIPQGEGRCFEVEGRSIAVFEVGGQYHAIDNVCPHRGGPLADGPLNGTTVICPWHGWGFDCTTGQSTLSPTVGVQTFAVTVEGTTLHVEL